MKFALPLLSLAIIAVNSSPVSPQLDNDVDSATINELLLEKAIPLKEYEAKHVAAGGKPFLRTLGIDVGRGNGSDEQEHPEFMNVPTKQKRWLWWWWGSDDDGKSISSSYNDNDDYNANSNGDDNDGAYYQQEEEEEGRYYQNIPEDDYFNKKNMRSFQGYSLKFATCQKVQRFSVDAIQRGEYSSMVSDDIVVLRLCPTKTCSTYSQFGCSAGYGEYAMTASEYMTIIMTYQHAKHERFCAFCEDCGYYGDDASQSSYMANTCYAYSNECSNNAYSCGLNDDDNGGNDAYGNNNDGEDDESVYLQYLDYMDCQKVNDNNGNYYYLSPYCDSNSKVSMGIYYDVYCEQYAGDDVDVTNYLGNNFNADFFSEAQEIDCLECGESVSRKTGISHVINAAPFEFRNFSSSIPVSLWFD